MYANSYSKTIALLILINFCACAFIEDKLGIGTNNPSQIGQTPSDCQDTTDQGCQTPQTPSSLGTWDQMTDGPVGLLWASAAGVSGKGYVLNGCKDVFCVGNYAHKATLEFDPSMNSGLGSWTTRETFPEQVTTSVTNYIGFGASTGNIGLFGLGVYLVQTPPINISTFHHGDIFELTPYSSSLWTKIDRPSTVHADGQLDRRKNSVSLAIDQDIYLGMGSSASAVLDDWWKYDTISRNWKKLAPLPSMLSGSSAPIAQGRSDALAFSIGQKAYVGCGLGPNDEKLSDMWEFSLPSANSPLGQWTFLGFAPFCPRSKAQAFSIGNFGYVATGWIYDSTPLQGDNVKNDVWKFDPSQPFDQAITQLPSLPGEPRHAAINFVIGQNAYVGFGEGIVCSSTSCSSKYLKDIYRFTP
ncbi:MAG: hypothetical protein KDD48_07435 [Bdellovibrionales bacterium]|nr:hypothetical protein [Bdellovibrionales bacterium]